jgi:hypothetical protein
MKFSLINDFTIEYPELKINNIFIKYFMFYYINNIHKLKFILDLNIIHNDDTTCKFILTLEYAGKHEKLELEITDSHIHYITSDILNNILKDISYQTHTDFFDKLSDHINSKNQKSIQLKNEENNLNKPILQKLKEDALHFIKTNMVDNLGHGHLLINMLISEYDYYLKNKDRYKFSLEIDNLFHWFFKYNNIEFELILVPSIHPMIPPIIDIKKIYHDQFLMIKLIEQPYIVKWNGYHSVLRLAYNFVTIIQNYEVLNPNKEIVNISDETNFIINTFVKTKNYPQSHDEPNIYSNIFIEDLESGIDKRNTIIVNMTCNNPSKYKAYSDLCKMVNLMYFNRLLDLNIDNIDKFVLNILYNIPDINKNLKDKIKNYI